MHIEITNGKDIRFINLCQQLDEFLNDIVGGEKQREQYTPYNTLEDIHDVVLVVEGNRAIGCGSFKKYSDQIAEIKRVFVKDDYREQGIGRKIMEALEVRAKEEGYNTLILETGEILRGAMKLYEGLGFKRIANYGPYVEMPESICMEKVLVDIKKD